MATTRVFRLPSNSQLDSYLTQASASTIYAPIVPTTQTGFRNILINGDFGIDQRRNGGNQNINTSSLTYGVDRWYGFITGGFPVGMRRVAGTAPNQYNLQITGDPSFNNTAFVIGQRIEAANSIYLAGKTATLSVSLASSFLTSITWTAYYANTTDTFGTLASPTRTLIATGTFTINSTLTRYSTNISIPVAATTGIEITFQGGDLVGLRTATFAAVQLEEGSIATPFERRPIGTELALCQRYYCSSVSNSTNYFHSSYLASPRSDFNEALSVAYPTRMRIVPTLTVSFVNFDNAVNQGQLSTVDGFNQYFSCGNGGFPYAGWRASYIASAEL
jgi:hypothetical protein